MPSSPQLSILIPAYRAHGTIVRTVRSCLAQRFDDLEVIIASDDGTDYAATLAAAGIADARVRHVSSGGSASGEGITRNAALAVARGELISNVDADDALAPARYATLVPLAARYGAVIDTTGVYAEDGRFLKRPFAGLDAVRPVSAADILSPRVPFFPVFQRRFAGQGWTTVPFAADVVFNLELLSRCPTMVIAPIEGYRYVKRAGSITQARDAYKTAEAGYAAILELLAGERLQLTAAIRAAAHSEFTANRRLNRLFQAYMAEGRTSDLEAFLEASALGRAAWVDAAYAERGL